MHLCQPVYTLNPRPPVEVCPDCAGARLCPCCGRRWHRWPVYQPNVIWGGPPNICVAPPVIAVRHDNYAGAVGALAG